jgi:hypothetical protein
MSTEQTVKKTLAAKYTKFMVYGFKLAQSLKDQDLIDDEVYNYMMKEQNMYGTVDAQTEFFESFFEDMKSSAKLMKQQIRQHNKPLKAKKEKVVDPDAPKAKRGRKKKEVVDNSTPEEKLVADIVAAAKSETIEPVVEQVAEPVVEQVVEQVVEPVVSEKPKRGRKSKKQVVEEKPEVLEEPVKIKEEKMEKTPDAPVKQKRAAAPKKTTKKKAKEPEQAPETPPIDIKPVVMTEELKEEPIDEEDDEEIETTVYVEDNVEYLIDNKNNVYHRKTFDELGKLNTETNRIEFTHPHLMENIVDEN